MTRSSAVALRAGLLLLSVLLFVTTGEVALRIVFRDAGTATLGGPGGQGFDHLTIDAAGLQRGRRDLGHKKPSTPRVMVIGDSITYGLGVRDWRQTWPELLARELEKQGRRHEFVVFGIPGNEMPQHVEIMQQWVRRVAPDVVIYQWYVNDLEATSRRPDATRLWQRSPWHGALRQWSYLYFVLDHRFAQLLPTTERSYVNYILTDFAPGTAEWGEFERQFHAFAVLAAATPRRIMLLYPQVPYRGEYPLRVIHERMKALAGSHQLDIAPSGWIRAVGGLAAAPETLWKQVLPVPPGFEGTMLETLEYVLPPGETTLTVSVMPFEPVASSKPLGSIQLLDARTGDVVLSREIQTVSARELQDVAVRVNVPDGQPRPFRIRVHSYSGAGWALARLRLSVDYGFEVVDMTEALNGFDTHASPFDAHPNESAHRAMAQTLYRVVTVQ